MIPYHHGADEGATSLGKGASLLSGYREGEAR